ncbi:protein CHROMOSOME TRANSMISSION FIDELITY 7 isoform X2 [Mercurialis annua]|uniref:protein CHROMOSOME TRANSMISSION FIDELITY 7 isoform X2 n=1 Tax=Mercurialis annua TaxID=3986 RepID=UPI0024AD83CD|nr:protein CHROMOSOME TRANSMISSION FIDELITY 7 isoform X2 [Mercurialis annua]
MQSKINSFFKPSSSSPPPKLNPDTSVPQISDDGTDDLALWEKAQHQFLNIYHRRSPKLANGENRAESNKGDELTKPVSMDLNLNVKQRSKAINNKRSYAQFYLDLGQSDFNLKACSVCGVKYAPGEEGDEKEHKVFHKNYTCGVQFKGFRNERVVRVPCDGGGRIVLVSDCDSSAQRNKEVVSMMEIELGGGWIFHKLCKVYLYISSQRVAGCLVAEPIKEAFKVLPRAEDERLRSASNKKSKLNATTLRFGEIILQREITKKVSTVDSLNELSGNQNGAIICEEDAEPAICGIRAIWVTPSNRRKRIATQLLDAARRSFCMGYSVEQSQLAFSPPSAAGKALASTYTGTSSFLVYKPIAVNNQKLH